ncbi:hypothetical protein A0J61_00027 [Choanephora cucurbitarum]|uniref:UspA domain-containing protein n=1 Tax=Choanephora cucurbitarum TaxID=101091 RepID=A0A1C7NT66_9FUNG|nr:hypothetical protein A0J61_00027 [Choanephora cucurbitarum]
MSNSSINEEHPLTTEEPLLDHPELLHEFKEINQIDPRDKEVPPAVIVHKEDPNKIISPFHHGNDEVLVPPQTIIEPNVPESTLDESDEDESDMDDELMRITESNRYIPVLASEEIPKQLHSVKSLRSQSVTLRRHLLVFAEQQNTTKKSDRIIVSSHYGAGPEGVLPADLKPTRRSRAYLVACDFSDESFHAIEWTMGTMMRDGDKLYVATAVNREDNPDTVKEAGLSLSKELKKASDTVTEEAKKILNQMLLFDVQLITYAICGRVKDVLSKLIEELPLTMVVCGSRGRGTVKGLLMGSISTFLVHKSPVPVTVIRPQKKKKATQTKTVRAASLSQSVETGQLAVDELSKTPSR